MDRANRNRARRNHAGAAAVLQRSADGIHVHGRLHRGAAGLHPRGRHLGPVHQAAHALEQRRLRAGIQARARHSAAGVRVRGLVRLRHHGEQYHEIRLGKLRPAPPPS